MSGKQRGRWSRSEPRGEDAALSYFGLRRAIGAIGFALPVVLLITGLIDHHFEESMSAYYYTDVGNYFTGTMCVIGVFLIAYRAGDLEIESLLTKLAGIAAFGVAFFHSTPAGDPTHQQQVLGKVHLTCAGVLFTILGVISFFFFTYGEETAERLKETTVYRVLGVTIWVSIAAMLAWHTLWPSFYKTHNVLFWLETVCVLSFSLSFAIKGRFVSR